MKTYYGLLNQENLNDIVTKVVDCLGNGANNTAHDLLLETTGAETIRGTFYDATKGAGMGISQFDKMPFYDVKNRISRANKLKVFEYFGIHLDWVEWEDLRYNPLLAMIFTRLKYKLIKEEIPKDLLGRAKYWKKFYNTYHPNAKGTIEHYIESNRKFMQ